jgi:hypothetical protein
MIQALIDIGYKRCGADQRTEKPLKARGLIVASEQWPYTELTEAGKDELRRALTHA